jgi:hypothetical protein
MARPSRAARAWIESGAMDLTGRAEGPPLVAPDDVVERIVALGDRAGVDAVGLLAERARYTDTTRRGARSCGGATRLLPAPEGWLAPTLARPDDVAAVPAWLQLDAVAVDERDPWTTVEAVVAERAPAELIAQAELLGMPVGVLGEVPAPESGSPVVITDHGDAAPLGRRPLVVDLSSLWAGPLCTRILADAGARVVKVESIARPDGARRGDPDFYRWLNGGKEELLVDFDDPDGRTELDRLLVQAQVVVEGSRPRALAQRGIAAEDLLHEKLGPSLWVSITGHGRASDRVGFGDDAAVAGGLVAWDDDGPCFVADAAADPLAGIAAAGVVRTALQAGGRWLIDVPLARVAAHVAGPDPHRPWKPGPAT